MINAPQIHTHDYIECCPFCGSVGEVCYSDNTAGYIVSCDGQKDEECRGIMGEGFYGNQVWAIGAWNKRNIL